MAFVSLRFFACVRAYGVAGSCTRTTLHRYMNEGRATTMRRAVTRYSTTMSNQTRQRAPLATASATPREAKGANNYPSAIGSSSASHLTNLLAHDAKRRSTAQEALSKGKPLKASLQPHRHLKTRDRIVSLVGTGRLVLLGFKQYGSQALSSNTAADEWTIEIKLLLREPGFPSG
jgi:hypothetical protein